MAAVRFSARRWPRLAIASLCRGDSVIRARSQCPDLISKSVGQCTPEKPRKSPTFGAGGAAAGAL
jgi:hypothetical protein